MEAPLVHDAAMHIITIPGVLSAAECATLVADTEQRGYGDAPVTTSRGFVMMPELRNNTRVMFDDATLAAALWSRLAPAVPRVLDGWRAVGLNERLRFYRYEPGQKFAWHRDGAFVRSPCERSRLTVLVYLNHDCVGGQTEFDDGPRVEPRRGMALLFEHAVRHQGATLIAGRKYVLRSDVMYVAPWA